MSLIESLLAAAPDGTVDDLRIGLHWTAVVVEAEGRRRCGLASTLVGRHAHGIPDVPQAGQLTTFSARELAQFAAAEQPTMASLGIAALNALLAPPPDVGEEGDAGDVIARLGAGKSVALIGHFPFIDGLREVVGNLFVLEQEPQPGEYPEDAAPEILPACDVVAITGMTLINQTLDDLLALCKPQATVLILGPSVPLHAVLFEYGIDVISGAIVTAVEPVLRVVEQGGTFRQVRRAGVRRVTLYRPDFTL